MKKENKYINVLDFQQPEYPMTFIVGARGVGKTISALSQKLKYNYNNDSKFIYLRRYLTEIETSSFDLELLGRLIGHEVTRAPYTTDNGVAIDTLWVEDKPVAYLFSLSTIAKYKSNSFADVTEIVYDEFLDLRNRELKNETSVFMQFAMTVFRQFDRYKVLFLSNATNLYNCYFLDFEVLPTGRISKFRNMGIKIVMYETSSILETEHANSVLGKQVAFLEGDDGSSLSNNFSNAFDDFIRKLPPQAKYLSTFRLNGDLYGYFLSDEGGVISRKHDASYKSRFALRYTDQTEDYRVIDFQRYSGLRAQLFAGQLFFTDVKTRSRFMKVLRRSTVMQEED